MLGGFPASPRAMRSVAWSHGGRGRSSAAEWAPSPRIVPPMTAPRPLDRLAAWREDTLGGRDLTRWPTAAGAAMVQVVRWLVTLMLRLLPGRLRSRIADSELPWLVLLVTA